jgi:large subunit ribosomal protein L25
MSDISLKLTERTIVGKKIRNLRNDGFIPSVVYGGKAEPVATQSPTVETTKVAKVAGKHTPVNLMMGDKKKLAIIKGIDIDPVKHSVRHIAFHAIKQNEVITTEVPLVLTGMGDSIAERAGLVVLQAIEKIEVKATPAHLPESIEISVLDLATDDDKITLADVKLPKNVEFASSDQDMDLVIANVYEPGALQAANDANGGEAEETVEAVPEGGEAAAAAETE